PKQPFAHTSPTCFRSSTCATESTPSSTPTRQASSSRMRRRTPLDDEPAPCQSRRVKSCGPSGSQDLAFLGRSPTSFLSKRRWRSRRPDQDVGACGESATSRRNRGLNGRGRIGYRGGGGRKTGPK